METYNDSHTSYIQIEDVYEFSTSCFDPNLSHWNPFYHVPHPRLFKLNYYLILNYLYTKLSYL